MFPRAVGRWTTVGSPPNALGNNYAVAGASIDGGLAPVDTSFEAQVNLLVSDYPNGVPPGTLVVVAIGSNDVGDAVDIGGIWSTNLTGWQLQGSGFTVPNVGSTVTVQVANLKDLVAGTNNLVAFPDSPGLNMLSVTAVDAGTSTITLTNVTGTSGTVIPAYAGFEMAGRYILDLKMPIFTQAINALLADGATLIVALPQRTDFLPVFDRTPYQALAYSTWLYLYNQMASVISKKSAL